MQNQNINTEWKKVQGILQTKLNPVTYKMWVSKISANNLIENTIELSVASKYAMLNAKKYENEINEALKKVFNKNIYINFIVEKENPVDTPQSLGPLFEKEENLKINMEAYRKTGLSKKFTFENFIMGNNNQLAYAIGQSVSENPGTTYNPFFLYSGVGMGKTHLIHAIGNKILDKKPDTNIIYTTSEDFMNELIESIQGSRGGGRGQYLTNQFRKKFRNADVLIIDDIQFIVGRESTQQEFFHTFNALYMAGKQIIVTSDRPPKDFVNLEKRISSRFGSGMIADIQPPDLDTRIAILRYKRDQSQDDIPNEIIDYIAKVVETNIRELEGAYLQVLTKMKTENAPATIELVQNSIEKNLNVRKRKVVNPNEILKTVSKYYSVKTTDIKGKRRTKEIVIPRQVAMYLIREMTETSLVSVGDFLGGRDHTTIMHGIEKVEKELEKASKIKADVSNIKQML